MRKIYLLKSNALVFLIAGILAAAPALAEKPSWAGGEKCDRGKQNDRHEGRSKHGNSKHASSDRDEREGQRHEHFGD